MLEKTRLEELSIALPEAERKELLERITRRLEREESDDAIAIELRDEERQKIIAYEMRQANWWVRFRIWLRSLVSGRPPREVFVDVRLRQLRGRIRSASPGLTGFDTRDLTPRFARRLWDLYARLRPLLDPYHTLTSDRTARAGAYAYLVEQRHPEAKQELDSFVSGTEMENIYAETGQAEDIRRRLATRLTEYMRTVPDSLLSRLEEECRLHLAVGRLATFPFAVLFRYFSYALDESAEARPPSFEHAPVMLTLDLLERLYVPITLVRRLGADPAWAPEPITWWLLAHVGEQPAGSGDAERAATELGRHRTLLTELCREVEAFDRGVPLLDLVRYFRRDPWHQLVFNPPRLFLKSLYNSSLKARLAVDVEREIGTVKERVISRKSLDLLKVSRMTELPHYRESLGFDYRALGLPGFTHVRSLTLLYNYLLAQYKGPVQEAVQLLGATALANNRIMQNRLGHDTSTLEDLEARILLFDRTLAPEEDDGRQLARYAQSIATDLLMQKAWRGFAAQKDREARALFDKGTEALAGIRSIMEEVRTSNFETVRSLLKVLHGWKGRSMTLGQIIAGRSEAIAAGLKLMDQLIELEKGG